MPVATRERTLRTMRKTPVMLKLALNGVTAERARTAKDGADGWSVIEIMCHLRDFERLFFERTQQILTEDAPHHPRVDHEALAKTENYAAQDLQQAFDDYLATRHKFVALIENVTPEDSARIGVHPEIGDITVYESGLNAALHDLNHIEQIIRALEIGDALID